MKPAAFHCARETPPGETTRCAAVSTLLHAALLALMACWTLSLGRDGGFHHTAFDTAVGVWEDATAVEPTVVLASENNTDAESSAQPSRQVITQTSHSEPLEVAVLSGPQSALSSGPASDLLAKVPSSGGTGAGEKGDGDGDGGPSAPSVGRFFGIETAAKKIIYVVDCSTSMGFRSSFRAPTRLDRVRSELSQSIGMLGKDRQFYVVFFNHLPWPMPSSGPVDATNRRAAQAAVQWAGRFRPEGGTNPREALRAALATEPDVIFFLTDGAFDQTILYEVRDTPGGKIPPIHCIGFGKDIGVGGGGAEARESLPGSWFDRGQWPLLRLMTMEQPDGESILQTLAQLTGGRYVRVPE